MDVALVAQGVLVMRTNGGIEMILDLQYLSVGWAYEGQSQLGVTHWHIPAAGSLLGSRRKLLLQVQQLGRGSMGCRRPGQRLLRTEASRPRRTDQRRPSWRVRCRCLEEAP